MTDMLKPVGGNKVTPPEQAMRDLDAIVGTPTSNPVQPVPADPERPTKEEFSITDCGTYWRITGVQTSEKGVFETPRSPHTVDVCKKLHPEKQTQQEWAEYSNYVRHLDFKELCDNERYCVPSIPLICHTVQTLSAWSLSRFNQKIMRARHDIATLMADKILHTLTRIDYHSILSNNAEDVVTHNFGQNNKYSLNRELVFLDTDEMDPLAMATVQAIVQGHPTDSQMAFGWLTGLHYQQTFLGKRPWLAKSYAICTCANADNVSVMAHMSPNDKFQAMGFRTHPGTP